MFHHNLSHNHCMHAQKGKYCNCIIFYTGRYNIALLKNKTSLIFIQYIHACMPDDNNNNTFYTSIILYYHNSYRIFRRALSITRQCYFLSICICTTNCYGWCHYASPHQILPLWHHCTCCKSDHHKRVEVIF